MLPGIDGYTLPANLPALAFDPGTGPTMATVTDLVVEGPGAVVIPTSVEPDPVASGFMLVRFKASLAAATGYQIRWNEVCSLPTLDAPTSTPRTRLFDVGPAVDPPFSLGTVTFKDTGTGYMDVSVALSASMKKFGPLAMRSIRRDGFLYRHGATAR